MAELVTDVGDGASIPRIDNNKNMNVADLVRSYIAACSEESDDNPKALVSADVRFSP